MPVSGVVIQCAEGCAGQVVKALEQKTGVEVHGVVDENRIVAVIEADTVNAEVDIVSELGAIDGVITVHLAYHNFEDLE